jgi:hypothetical protein
LLGHASQLMFRQKIIHHPNSTVLLNLGGVLPRKRIKVKATEVLPCMVKENGPRQEDAGRDESTDGDSDGRCDKQSSAPTPPGVNLRQVTGRHMKTAFWASACAHLVATLRAKALRLIHVLGHPAASSQLRRVGISLVRESILAPIVAPAHSHSHEA